MISGLTSSRRSSALGGAQLEGCLRGQPDAALAGDRATVEDMDKGLPRSHWGFCGFASLASLVSLSLKHNVRSLN